MKRFFNALGTAIARCLQGIVLLGKRLRWLLLVCLLIGGCGYYLSNNPPIQQIAYNELGIRTNLLTGEVSQWQPGSVTVLPLIHQLRTFSLRDHLYQPENLNSASSPAALQSREGLSIGANMNIRYAIDAEQLTLTASGMPEDLEQAVIAPALNGVVYRVFSQYTVREIFSVKRLEIQEQLEKEMTEQLSRDGILLRSVQLGSVDLPEDYKRGMDALLAEELASEKMRYTLELREKQLQAQEMEARSNSDRREISAQAAAREQIIAAQAQEEAMKHVIPFKERQIQQRKLEAEAEASARIQSAQGNSRARQIEAEGESLARQKLADAEAYRLERIGMVNAEQMAREGAVLTQHPLLIQKTMADKLSDKLQVIIAPPSTSGDIISGALLNRNQE